jgi:hypothetical protein
VLADPSHAGFALSAYLVPAVAVFAAGALLLAWLGLDRRRRVRAGSPPPDAPSLSARERDRVDAALERWSP